MELDKLIDTDRRTIYELAQQSLWVCVHERRRLSVNIGEFSKALQLMGASFVTLNKGKNLRGCIGTLEARKPLIQDVADHAYAAACQDPRFPPVTENELQDILVSVSVLSPPEDLVVESLAMLKQKLESDKPGLILRYGPHGATYLPSVWEQVEDSSDFIGSLMQKAGLPSDFWSDQILWQTYRVNYIQAQDFK
ncbi:AmmeMemoRadiSam system protein A [Oleiphilus messinensis]|nr:AmmeMemoRadiSam system protein A [Oleiphilus messinensis]